MEEMLYENIIRYRPECGIYDYIRCSSKIVEKDKNYPGYDSCDVRDCPKSYTTYFGEIIAKKSDMDKLLIRNYRYSKTEIDLIFVVYSKSIYNEDAMKELVKNYLTQKL